jgi:CDP-glycerol glycerophosphotransferase (TagB/SpsB family)
LEQLSEQAWHFEVQTGARVVVPFGFETSAVRVDQRIYSAHQSTGKALRVSRRDAGPMVDVIANADGSTVSVVTSGDLAAGAARLTHDHTGASFPVPAADTVGSGATWQLDLADLRKWGRPTPLREGRWRLELLCNDRWVKAGTTPADTTEFVDRAAWSTYALERRYDAVIFVSRRLPRAEGGIEAARPANEALAARIRESDPVTDAVVFECFFGRQVACHPRALVRPIADRLPGAELLWVTQPGQQYAPPGTRRLVRWTAEWYERMASACLVVTNSDLAPSFRRHPDQVVLQTWHGTPLKRIALDMINFDNFRPSYRDEIVTQSEQWTHLVSPNEFCSDTFPAAFGFTGPLIEVGSPRNDLLIGDRVDEQSARVRADLGLSPHDRVILFAPTWRENVREGSHRAANNTLDLESLVGSLGPDVRLLYRAHNNVLRQRGVSDTNRVINVSDFPDIADLYLAADVLVTDYSSVMFDYACLGRPMVFHCTDLETYRDEVRGWYFDFIESAPGPITRTAFELRSALREVLESGVPAEFQGRLEAFRDRYTAWEDGRASERVAEVVTAAVIERRS